MLNSTFDSITFEQSFNPIKPNSGKYIIGNSDKYEESIILVIIRKIYF